jgi:RNA polymerase sigma-54 factor
MVTTPRLETRLSQQLTLTASLKQAIEILHLSTLDLIEHISEQLDSNPFLEGEIQDPWLKRSSGVTDAKGRSLEEWAFDDSQTLQNYLREQIIYFNLPADYEQAAIHIIEAINPEGYLDISLEDISKENDISMELLLKVLEDVQTLEPKGVGARSLKECLAIQGEQGACCPQAFFIILDYLEDIANCHLQKIIKETSLKQDEIIEAICYLKTLDPKPGLQIDFKDEQTIVPDVIIEKTQENFQIHLNQDRLQNFGFQKDLYESLKKTTLKEDEKKYIQDQYTQAKFLVRAVNERSKTLLKLTNYILESQKDFFMKGVKALKPMNLKDIAEALGFHESTISRAVAHKYMKTPYGILPYKFFLSKTIQPVRGDRVHSSKTVHYKIKEIIEDEDKLQPFSDEDLVIALKAQSIQIARRTITKYREALGIPSSALRKRRYKIAI